MWLKDANVWDTVSTVRLHAETRKLRVLQLVLVDFLSNHVADIDNSPACSGQPKGMQYVR